MGELKRRLVHASGTGLPLLYLVGVLSWAQTRYAYLALSLLVTGLEFVRLVLGYEWNLFDELAREYERENVAGYALYAYSQTAVALVFAPFVAVPGMLMLTVGDPISGYLGSNDAGTAKRYGVLGVMYLVCFALAMPVVLVGIDSLVVGVAAAAVGAAGATLADGIKPVVAGYVVDDNLSIPPAACVGITLVCAAAGVPLSNLIVPGLAG